MSVKKIYISNMLGVKYNKIFMLQYSNFEKRIKFDKIYDVNWDIGNNKYYYYRGKLLCHNINIKLS